jgi:hypothetical protein
MKSFRSFTEHFSLLTPGFILVGILMLLPLCTRAQSNLNTELIGQMGEGPRNCVLQQDSFLLVNSGTLLEIYVIRDTTLLLKSQTTTRGFVDDMAMHNSLVYLAIESLGMCIYDMADITQPEEIGFLAIGGYDATLMTYQNYVFYATNSSIGLHLIDVSDPVNPILKESFPISSIRNMVHSGHYLYAANAWYGFTLFDLSNIDEIDVVYASDEFFTYDIDIVDHFACVVQGDSTAFMDFTNPASPITYSKIALNNIARCIIDTAEHRVILAGYNVYNVDISNPYDPKISSTANVSSYTEDLVYKEDRLTVITEEKGGKVFEIDTAGNFELVTELPTFGISMSIAIFHDYAYLANNNNGMNLFDVSDPQNPAHIKSFSTEKNVRYLEIRDHYLYCSSNGLKIFDIANPENPAEVAYVELPGRSQGFQIKNDRLYLAADANGLLIIDISDPTLPQIIGQLETPGNAYQVDVHEDTLYLAAWTMGLRIIDISDETSPTEIAVIDSSWITPLKSIKVIDNYAWLGSTNFGIRIMDIRDLSNPVRLQNLNTARGHDIQKEEKWAYVSAGYRGFYIFDSSDPADPDKIGFYNTPGRVYHSCKNGDYFYLADYNCGFSIIRFDHCSSIAMETSTQKISCFASCDGSISVDKVLHAQEPIAYSWSDGSTSPFLENLCAGTYALTIYDAQNCVLSDTFDLAEPDELLFESISVTDIDDTHPYGSIEISLEGGTPEYSYYWEGPDDYTSVSSNLYFLEEGCYRLTVTDAQACILNSDEICVHDNTTGLTATLIQNEIMCYPNPADDRITLDLKGCKPESSGSAQYSLEIYDLMGKKLWSKSSVGKIVDISGVPEGLYWLKVKTKDREKYLRIAIQR